MDIAGLCSICGEPGAMYSCILCGKLVCINCYDAMHNICSQCKIGP